MSLPTPPALGYNRSMTHALLVRAAIAWLRRYRCGVVLSEQACISGEVPDALGWKRACHSVLIECKISRADFLADRAKPFRREPGLGVGSERFYLVPRNLIRPEELPAGWGLLQYYDRGVHMLCPSRKDLRTEEGFRIEPQTITDFLKWQNRMAEYNGGQPPKGVIPPTGEGNFFLDPTEPSPDASSRETA